VTNEQSDGPLRRYLRTFDDQLIPKDIPSSLPLLDELRRDRPFREVFAGVDALFVQHHLAPLVPRVKGMSGEGLDLKRCWFVDVPYSTNDQVRQRLIELVHQENHWPEPFDDPLKPYAVNQMRRVERVLEAIADRATPRRLLVLDDGAYFTRSLARLLKRRPSLATAFEGACIVEQTTYGDRYLRASGQQTLRSLRMPAVSIARCETKLRFESHFIGASVSRAILKTLSSSHGA